MSAASDQYRVVGDPIAHSLSPRLHQAFARETGQLLSYTAERVEAGTLGDWLHAFRAAGGRGLNVTVPLKVEALSLADAATSRARQAGAANTLWFDRTGRCLADNTDGVGLVTDLTANLRWQLKGARVLVLGAGGAVRGILGPLHAAGVARIWIANRSAERAESLVAAFAATGMEIGVLVPGAPLPAPVDLIINGTSAGLSGGLPDLPPELGPVRPCAYDMLYGPKAAPLRTALETLGVTQFADGLGMLVEQAATAFWIWRGIRPSSGSVLKSIRSDR
jgi:shikimate dehydrogenase